MLLVQEFQSLCSIALFLVLHLVVIGVIGDNNYSRTDFPAAPYFVFGSGGSAYQVEGAASEDGRTPSIWDTFAHADHFHGANGDIACDEYHKYKEDVQLMVETGLEAYRFSISWSRLIPNGKGPINPKGLQYYNNFINEIISHGIEPHVTLFHSDLPQALEDEYGGWLSRKIVKHFTAFAEVCFKEFGDRILYWTTLNEANVFALGGYDMGATPPGRCSPPFGSNCTGGNSSTETYIAAHNLLLAHAAAAELYKRKYKAKQQGFIGLNLYAYWLDPYTNAMEDVIATQRANDFLLGWFLNPLVFGDYPHIMKKNVGNRLPTFTKLESKLLKSSCDFVGLNHYLTLLVKDNSNILKMNYRDLYGDAAIEIIYVQKDTTPIQGQFPIAPFGLQRLLEYLKNSYGNPPIYIHENGQGIKRNTTLNDIPRVEYLHAYIGAVLNALRNGSNTRGYFAWSFLDALELLSGYETGFGLYYVDLDDKNLTRYAKTSAHWYSKFLKGKSIGTHEIVEAPKGTSAL